ncbi:MAG: sugar transferase [Lentisphaeraceae bacterium]|nr:sugar transferase [Lentisphaeraceae bacterium]
MPRALELLLVLITLPLWGAAILLIALVLAFDRPIFFRQERPGLYGRPFTLIKFRTMRPGPEPDAERLTCLGRFLRATSLDELPELLNVLRGEMALVGPRPLLMAYLAEYTPAEHHRHDVRPGITGWAQVHGRNAITRADKVRYDLDYIARRSTAFDFYILCLTIFHLRGN